MKRLLGTLLIILDVAALATFFVLSVYCRGIVTLPSFRREKVALAGASDDDLKKIAGRRLTAPKSLTVDGQALAHEGSQVYLPQLQRMRDAGVDTIVLEDWTALRTFAMRRLILTEDAKDNEGKVILPAGTVLHTKETRKLASDDASDVKRVHVHGVASVISFNGTVILVVLNFFAVVVALHRVFWRPVIATLDARNERIAGDRSAAEHAEQEAQRLESEFNERSAIIRRERLQRMDRARLAAYEEASRIIGEARKESEKIWNEARRDLHGEVRAARGELRGQIPGLAIDIVRQLIGRDVDTERHQGLLSEAEARFHAE